MPQITSALIEEQGVTFAIVIVKPHVLNSSSSKENMRNYVANLFPSGIPIILMAQDYRGVPIYEGRADIVDFLVNVSIDRIPWKTYTVH